MEMEIVFSGGKKVDALFGGFTVRTDQSVAGGGEGSAPEPFQLFLASMGTCAGIYVLSFCRNRGLPWEGIRLIQRSVFNKETGFVEKVIIDIEVPESFPEKYRGALVRSALQCAVKRHIAAGLPKFEVSVVPCREEEDQCV